MSKFKAFSFLLGFLSGSIMMSFISCLMFLPRAHRYLQGSEDTQVPGRQPLRLPGPTSCRRPDLCAVLWPVAGEPSQASSLSIAPMAEPTVDETPNCTVTCAYWNNLDVCIEGEWTTCPHRLAFFAHRDAGSSVWGLPLLCCAQNILGYLAWHRLSLGPPAWAHEPRAEGHGNC